MSEEQKRIKTWPPIILVKRKTHNFLGFKKRRIKFGCGHTDYPLNYLEVADTNTKIWTTSKKRCPACYQSFIIKHSTVCAECGHMVTPGDQVACPDYDLVKKQGLIPSDLPPAYKSFAMAHAGCAPAGAISGHWTSEGYRPINW